MACLRTQALAECEELQLEDSGMGHMLIEGDPSGRGYFDWQALDVIESETIDLSMMFPPGLAWDDEEETTRPEHIAQPLRPGPPRPMEISYPDGSVVQSWLNERPNWNQVDETTNKLKLPMTVLDNNDINDARTRSVRELCPGADEGSRVAEQDQDAARADPKPKPRVRFDDSHFDVSPPTHGMNIADRKRLKRARQRTTKEHETTARETMNAVLLAARRGYEHFHGFPIGSTCTEAQIVASSGGLSGYSKLGQSLEEDKRVADAYAELEHSHPLVEPKSGPVKIRLAECIGKPKSLALLTKAEEVALATTRGLPLMSTTPASGWEVIEITVDSGACDTVLPSNMLASITTESTEASRNMEMYEVANGHEIVNEGQKRCMMMTPGSRTPKGIVFQVSNVHKPLMSVGAMADAGFECLLSKNGGIMRDVDTGEMIPLVRQGNLYILRAWVRSADSPFVGPS